MELSSCPENGGACLSVLRWGPLVSNYMGGSSFLVEDEVENLYIDFEDSGSSVRIYEERALFRLLKI